MPIRMAITKQTAQGEQFVVDVCQWNPVTGEVLHGISEMSEMADEMLKLSDVRLVEMNTRMLEAYNLQQYCPPDAWTMVNDVLDVLAGRQSVDAVARRWQSRVEETRELEEIRRQAALAATADSIQWGTGK